jgi:crotonobetainyl-CoA:carnitine CoA-transferase CaiB-like acyl-CoA transferase
MSGPLQGVKVIELTSVVLGPWACQILGDLGADVIKVEPPFGDSNRQLGPSRNAQMCALYLQCNRNKRSLVLDLKQPGGHAALLKLVEKADVLVHNYRPRAVRRLGLEYEDLAKINPRIVYCGTYGYRADGPYGERGAYDDSIQAASGIAMLQESLGVEPHYLPTIVADKTTALAVVYAVIAALFYRERHGEGQAIEVPMFETMVSFVAAEHLYGLTFEPAEGAPGYARLLSPHRKPYKTRDGYIAILPYLNNHWETFCKLAGREDLFADERFVTLSSRLENIDEMYREVSETVATRTTSEWWELLGSSVVPTMVVNSLADLLDDPHLKETGFWQEVDHPSEGRLRLAGIPVGFSRSPGSIREMPPRLGEQSGEILREVGFGEAEIDEMITAGVTVQAPPADTD